jgi:hypothetical protein
VLPLNPYLQCCNISWYSDRRVKPFAYFSSCYVFKVATEKNFHAKATKKLIQYKIGNVKLNLQIKKQNIFLFLRTESLSFSVYLLLYEPHKPLTSMRTNHRSSGRYQRNDEQVPCSNSSVRWNHDWKSNITSDPRLKLKIIYITDSYVHHRRTLLHFNQSNYKL